ncbi:MAG: PAS domain S-box protein [bacterium]
MTRQISEVAAFIEDLPDLAFIATSSLNIIAMNSVGMQKLGYTADDVASKSVADFFPSDSVARVKGELSKVMGGEPTVCRVPVTTKKGDSLTLEFFARTMQAGTDRSLLVIGKDNSEVVRLEAEVAEKVEAFARLQKSHATLVRTVIHDIVNPLTGVLGNLDLLSRLELNTANGKFYQYLMTSRYSGQELQRLILSYHDLSAMETGDLRVQMEPCDFGEMMAKALEHFNWVAEQDQIKVAASISESFPMLVADRELIQRGIENIIAAVMRVTREGGKVRIEASLMESDPVIECTVSGTGNGIMDPRKAEAIRSFLESDDPAIRYVPSVNLTITHAHYALQSHKGKLEMTNQPGESVTYHFTLPMDGGRWG